MAKVHFAPFGAVKYVGAKNIELATSIARPKPILRRGDIVIVDKRTAFNMTVKGFGNYEAVEDISFVKADSETSDKIESLETTIVGLEKNLDEHKSELERLNTQIVELEAVKVAYDELVASLSTPKDETENTGTETLDTTKESESTDTSSDTEEHN